MKVIFLDIDGVLNHSQTMSKTPSGWTGLSENLVSRLGIITKETGAVVVLTTTWKVDWDKNEEYRMPDGVYLHQKLMKEKIFIFDKTESFPDKKVQDSFYRGREILNFLDAHPEITSYIILDDNEFEFEQYPDTIMPYFIHTDAACGLSIPNMNQALELLGKKVEQSLKLETTEEKEMELSI